MSTLSSISRTEPGPFRWKCSASIYLSRTSRHHNGLPAPDWEPKLLAAVRRSRLPPGSPAKKKAASTGQDHHRSNATTVRRDAGEEQCQTEEKRAHAAAPDSLSENRRKRIRSSGRQATATPPASDAFASQNAADLSQRASDGLLINGSQNNGASSPFSQNPAFGNNRRGLRSLYTGNFSFTENNSVLDAQNFSITGQQTPKSAQNFMTGAGSLSGPLRIPNLLRNGPLFTVNYQWMRNRKEATTSALVPTEAERNGDFSQALNAFGQPVQIFNPSGGAPFGGNVIPPTLISQQITAQALLKFYPMPNFAGGTRYNYQTSLVNITNQNSMQTRLQKQLGNKNQVNGIFAFQDTDLESTNLFGFHDKTSSLGFNSVANWIHTFPNRVILHFMDTYTRLGSTTTPNFANVQNVSGDAGIEGNSQQPVNYGPPSLRFNSSSIFGLSDASTRQPPTIPLISSTWTASGTAVPISSAGARSTSGWITIPFPSRIHGAVSDSPATPRHKLSTARLWRARATILPIFCSACPIPRPSHTAHPGRTGISAPIPTPPGRLTTGESSPRSDHQPANALGIQRSFHRTLRPSGESRLRPRFQFGDAGCGGQFRQLADPSRSARISAARGILLASVPGLFHGRARRLRVYYNTSAYQALATQMAQQPPESKTFNLPNFPPDPTGEPRQCLQCNHAAISNTFAVDPDFRVGYAQNSGNSLVTSATCRRSS